MRPLPPLSEMQGFCSEATRRRLLPDVKRPRQAWQDWEEPRKGGVPAGVGVPYSQWLFLPVGA